MESQVLLSCSQPGCLYETSGICMEGNKEGCQFVSNIISMVTKTQVPEIMRELPLDVHQLSSNDEILDEQVSRITDEFQSNLILVIGDPESGKSTLYASLFDRFQKGAFAEYYFAGTKTPVGFERKCHHARLISMNPSSSNERTKTKEFSYLHLAVRHKSLTLPTRHLLFADVNGEKFQAARNADDEMKSLTVLKRADHICFLADGELLVDPKKRQSVKLDAVKIIDRALQNNMINRDKGIHFLITKWDKILTSGKEKEVSSFFIDAMNTKYTELIRSVIKVASRSENPKVPPGTGIDEFLQLSLSNPAVDMSEDIKDFEILKPLREYQKYRYERK